MAFGGAMMRLFGSSSRACYTTRARVLAVAAQKGGVGKTTTAVNIAAAAVRYHGLRTLIVDLDGQGHVAKALSTYSHDSITLSDILLGNNRDLMEIVRPTRIPDLYFTPSDKGLAATEGILAGRIGKEFLLRHAMRRARENFDFIVLDCPPNLGNLTLNGLIAADACLIPCDMSILALEGVSDILSVIETLRERLNHDITLAGIVPTRVDRRNQRVTDAVLSGLSARYKGMLCNTFVPVSSALSRAQMEGRDIFEYDASSRGAQAYKDLAEEIIRRLENARKEAVAHAS